MIKKISNIKNFGVFQNYRRTGNIQDFRELNIIYGWNYTGKTTISRLFNCLEREETHPDYHGAEFEIYDSDDKKYTNSNMSIDSFNIRVFNTDFIKRNLKWDGESFEPILLIGEESLEAQKLINEKEKYLSKLIHINSKMGSTKKAIEDSIEVGLSDLASNIKNNLSLVATFTKAHIRPIFNEVKENHSSFLIHHKQFPIILKDATSQLDDKLSTISPESFELKFPELFNAVKELVCKTPKFSSTIEYFVENPEVATWVENGLLIHEEKTTCEFCGNKFTENRKNDLLAHFSKDLKNHRKELTNLKEQIILDKIQLLNHTESEFYQSLRSKYKEVKEKISDSVKNYNKQLDNLLTIVVNKIDKPFEKIIDFKKYHQFFKRIGT